MNTHINRAYSQFLSTGNHSQTLTGFASRLAKFFKAKQQAWQTRRRDRRAIEQLLEMKEHHLKDIGLTRNDLHWASHLPDHVNASLRLQKLARRRPND